MAFPSSKPGDKDGKTKAYVTGSPEDGGSNRGGSKGAKIIGTATNGSSGKLKTYKTSVKGLNTGAIEPMGGATNIKKRNEI